MLLMLKAALHFLLNISRFICVQKEKKASQLSATEQVRGQYEQSPFDPSTLPIFSIQYLCCVLLFSVFLWESVSISYVRKLCSEDTASSAWSYTKCYQHICLLTAVSCIICSPSIMLKIQSVLNVIVII